jgi:glycosyltransferase involved in cell wall biosynthesis
MVFFQGLKKPEEVAQFMQKSDIFLMFSNYEGLPCVILESFACGLPVAATSVGGIPEVVNSNRGILVSKGNEMAMCSALNAMLNNLNIYDRENLNSYAHNNFSNERVGKAYIDLYKMAIALNHSEIRN